MTRQAYPKFGASQGQGKRDRSADQEFSPGKTDETQRCEHRDDEHRRDAGKGTDGGLVDANARRNQADDDSTEKIAGQIQYRLGQKPSVQRRACTLHEIGDEVPQQQLTDQEHPGAQ